MGHEITGIASEYVQSVILISFLPNQLPRDMPHRLGDDVDKDKIKTGERYSVLSIGGCISCIAKSKGIPPSEDPGTEFLQLPFLGIGANGGHAEYVVVDADLLVPVVCRHSHSPRSRQSAMIYMLHYQPGNVLPEHAAVMADAGERPSLVTFWSLADVWLISRGITAWHAIKTTASVSTALYHT